ncbi:MAG: DUF1120 domain-containing protein [Enterobacteriaceae bacterium]
MKKTRIILSSLTSALLLTASGLASAEDPTLVIKGTLVPPGCTPTMEGGGVIDYGRILNTKLQTEKSTILEDKPTALVIDCQADMKLGFMVTDDRNASKPLLGSEMPAPLAGDKPSSSLNPPTQDTQTFGLGTDSKQGKVGVWWFTVKFTELAVDGVTGKQLLASNNSGVSWSQTTTAPLDPLSNAGAIAFSIGNGNNSSPVAGKVHRYPLVVGAAINKQGALSLTEDVPLDGKATFRIYYY